MKKCHYCAKEIDYSEMYCSAECEEKANKYFRTRQNVRIVVNITYVVCILLIAVGIIFTPSTYELPAIFGIAGVATGGIVSGIITLLLPSPTDDMIRKHKMQKAQNIFRIYGIVLLAVGVAALVITFVRIFG